MPLFTVTFLGYFGYHTFNGAYGKWSLDRMKAQAAAGRSPARAAGA